MSDDLQAVNPRAGLFRTILSFYGVGIYIFLFAPIAVLILLSFNSSSVVGFPMAGFTTDWYSRLSQDNVILDALEKSLFVAFWVTVLATLIGTAAAFPLVRANIKSRGGVRVFITLPIMMPGLLIGVAILVLATNVLHIQPSLKVAIIGQTVLATPFVILVVSSRLEALDRNLERAAADLGAGPLQRLLFVVLPLIYPGIIAGALIALTLSLDEFVVTNFIIGADQTLPIYIYNQLKFGITPEVNALATLMLLGTLAVAGLTFGALRLVKVLTSFTKKSNQAELEEPARAAVRAGGDVSVVLEAFLDHSLEETLTWLSTEVPEVTAVEVGAGGYAPHPHLDPDELLTDASARQAWLSTLEGHGIRLDALNVWGNPLHPDKAIADDHDAALRRAVRLAGELGTNTSRRDGRRSGGCRRRPGRGLRRRRLAPVSGGRPRPAVG